MPKRQFPDLCSHTFSNLPARPKTADKKESQNKESVASWLLIKNKLMWYFLPYQSQFSNIAENKH